MQNIASIWDFLGRNNTEFENVDGLLKKLHSQIETLYKNQALYNINGLNMEKIANLYLQTRNKTISLKVAMFWRIR